MAPVRLHLDTSDYAAMYNAPPDTPEARARDRLLEMKAASLIEIGLSHHVVFELLQNAPPQYRADRIDRAQMLTKLCDRNAFPYPSDLGQGFGFSMEGLWIPRIDLENLEIEKLVQATMKSISAREGLNGHERRAVSKRAYFVEWMRSDPAASATLVQEQWPLLFAKDFVGRGDFRRYLLGELSRDEVNKMLHFYITDPVSVYEIWFENYGWDNPVTDRRDKIANKLADMLSGYKAMLDDQASLSSKIKGALAETGDKALPEAGREAIQKLKLDVQTFKAEITSPEELGQHPAWIKLVGDEGALVASQIFYGLYREKRDIKRSDAIDLIHAMYLPHTDLWRGDKAFSALLIKNQVKYHERDVSTLAELPDRIMAEIARRTNELADRPR